MAERYDFARFDAKPTVTPQGFLRIRANLTRVGVLRYQRADGSVARELRHPSEVFSRASLSTLEGAPLTDLHDGGMVSPSNVRRLQIGTVGETLRTDGRFVNGHVTVQDAVIIQAVQSGDRHELSPGYEMDLDETPGEYHGERYDGVQRNIVYNHVAIGPRNWGRAGNDVSLRMDGGQVVRVDHNQLSGYLRDQLSLLPLSLAGAAQQSGIDQFRLDGFLEGFGIPTDAELQSLAALIQQPVSKLLALIPAQDRGELPIERRDAPDGSTHNNGVRVMKVNVRVDGVEYPVEVPDALASNFQQGLATMASGLEQATTESAERQGRVDALTTELATAKTDLATAQDSERIEERVTELVQLRTDAASVLPDDTDLSGKSVRQIKEAVILHRDAEARLDGKDDGYINGMFDVIVSQGSSDGESGIHAARKATVTTVTASKRTDADDQYNAEAARERMLERNRNMWQPKAQA